MKKYKYRKTFTYEGKRYSVYGDTMPQVYEKMGKKMAELESGKKQITKNMRFDSWVEEWLLTYKEPTVSPESLASYRSNLKCHVLPILGPMPLKSIKAIHCQRVINEMSGMSTKMLSRISQLMYSVFEDALDNGLIFENPARKVKLPKGTRRSRRTITQEERQYILTVADKHRAGLWVLLMLCCGLRPAEAAGLRWMDIDMKNHTLTVNQAVKRSGGVGPPKTEAGYRKIPVPDLLYERLSPGDPFDYVCKNTKGGRLTSTSMQRMWDYFKNAMNIEMGCAVSPKGQAIPPYRVADDLVPYCLRHTYCTDLRDAGVDITVAKVLMGHSDISITAGIYTHQTDDAFNDAAEKINAQGSTPGSTPKKQKSDKIRNIKQA